MTPQPLFIPLPEKAVEACIPDSLNESQNMLQLLYWNHRSEEHKQSFEHLTSSL